MYILGWSALNPPQLFLAAFRKVLQNRQALIRTDLAESRKDTAHSFVNRDPSAHGKIAKAQLFMLLAELQNPDCLPWSKMSIKGKERGNTTGG